MVTCLSACVYVYKSRQGNVPHICTTAQTVAMAYVTRSAALHTITPVCVASQTPQGKWGSCPPQFCQGAHACFLWIDLNSGFTVCVATYLATPSLWACNTSVFLSKHCSGHVPPGQYLPPRVQAFVMSPVSYKDPPLLTTHSPEARELLAFQDPST